MKQVHIFDVDHTLISASSGGFFALRAIREGVFSFKVFYRLPLYYLYYRHASLKQHQMDNGLGEFRGTARSTFDRISQEAFECGMKEAIYPNMEALVRHILAQGHRVLLATSSADFIVKPLADYLGIHEIVATRLMFDQKDLCTGHFDDGFAMGDGKRIKVEKYLAETGSDPALCWFYSDSYHDLPLLAQVHNPVAVNPDIRLSSVARKKGWPILRGGKASLPLQQLVPV